ncbi:unnamed protein product, partial [Laminaria digitata]
AAAAAASGGAERQLFEQCSHLSPVGAVNFDSVVGSGSIGSRLRAGAVAVTRVPTVVDPAAANTADDTPQGPLATVAAATAAPPPPPSLSPLPENSVYLSCSRPSSFQRLPKPRAVGGAGVSGAVAVAGFS